MAILRLERGLQNLKSQIYITMEGLELTGVLVLPRLPLELALSTELALPTEVTLSTELCREGPRDQLPPLELELTLLVEPLRPRSRRPSSRLRSCLSCRMCRELRHNSGYGSPPRVGIDLGNDQIE